MRFTADEDRQDVRWAEVYTRWLDSDPEPMAAWLVDSRTVIPEDARFFLAELVRGKAKRPRGRRAERSPRVERMLVAEVYAAREKHAKNRRMTQPHERAIADVANAHGMTAPAVRGVVDRHHRVGLTYEAWLRWGRPAWS